MKIFRSYLQEIIREEVKRSLLKENLSNFTSAGIPAEYAKNLVDQFNFDENTRVVPFEGMPKASDLDIGDMIINVLPSGDVIGVLKNGRRRLWNYRITLKDSKFYAQEVTSISKAMKGMSPRGKMFKIEVFGWNEWLGVEKTGKSLPSVDDL